MASKVFLSVNLDKARILSEKMLAIGDDTLHRLLEEEATCGCMGCAIRIDAAMKEARKKLRKW